MIQDPIADMLTRIRNAQQAQHPWVSMPASKIKTAIARVLHAEGYLTSFEVTDDSKPQLRLQLKWFQQQPVIERIRRISRPGLRVYRSCDALPSVNSGLGISIISTSKGLMTDSAARKRRLGGEVVCEVV